MWASCHPWAGQQCHAPQPSSPRPDPGGSPGQFMRMPDLGNRHTRGGSCPLPHPATVPPRASVYVSRWTRAPSEGLGLRGPTAGPLGSRRPPSGGKAVVSPTRTCFLLQKVLREAQEILPVGAVPIVPGPGALSRHGLMQSSWPEQRGTETPRQQEQILPRTSRTSSPRTCGLNQSILWLLEPVSRSRAAGGSRGSGGSRDHRARKGYGGTAAIDAS